MRIITGSARGVRLKTLEGENTRPTAERVKEAVFSMIQFDIEGRTVLDLFSGSGQMGLEALSRGAREAFLVDQSKDAVRIIEENAKKTGFSSLCRIFQTDFRDFLRRNYGQKFDLIFLDPPYASGFYTPALEGLLASDMLKPTSLLICESDTEEIFENKDALQKKFAVKKISKYSKTVITVLTPIM
ncbi:MAG: 16S rRNA (guanine(966)-N(2))-methyltransferase RsmD [Ruminococcaceae bacterium]|nr:16S rRNA (guanine(966)-N(2))-methyltransferase RsmD [Oscillospiraceae bacterium]